MRRPVGGAVAVAVVLALCASACERPGPPRGGRSAPTATRAAGPTADPRAFGDPGAVDNRWFPLRPGTRFVYSGTVSEDGRSVPHRVVFVVTDLTKVIDGVRTLVVWDRDYSAGRLVEGELAFFAQDDGGTVWSFGEYPEEYEDGRLQGAPDTWLAGLAGARRGVMMPSDPRTGTASYLQGWAPEIDFADRARVYLTGQAVCVPVACYRDVLVTDEWNPSEPGAHQRKFYAPGVGNVQIAPAGGREQEGLLLSELTVLGGPAMAAVRRAALRLDRRAVRVSRGLYARSAPAEPPATTE
jgi:hypothetical protein